MRQKECKRIKTPTGMNNKTIEFGFLRGFYLPWPSALVPVATCNVLFVLHNSSHYTQPQSISISISNMDILFKCQYSKENFTYSV